MNIEQELERLHKSFQINQTLSDGDRAEEILGLISRLLDSALIPYPVPSMDLILKNEMTKPVYTSAGEPVGSIKTDETLACDNHGFDFPEELQPTFDKFKQFLKDNDAEAYWEYFEDDKGFFGQRNYRFWVADGFDWTELNDEEFWQSLSSKWYHLK
jgi:hypothetical protein